MRTEFLLGCGLLFAASCQEPSVSPTGEFLRPPPRPGGEPARGADLPVAELQLYVVPFNRKVRQLPGFSDLYIEHQPRWHVVVNFTHPPRRERVLALAPPVLRDRIVIRAAKRTQAQIEAELEAITVAVNRLGIDYTGGYDPKTQRFYLTVASRQQVEPVRSVLPASVRDDTEITVGALPVPERAIPR